MQSTSDYLIPLLKWTRTGGYIGHELMEKPNTIILLKEPSYKMTSSMPLSSQIREASFRRWELTQKLDSKKKVRFSGALTPKWDIFIKVLPQVIGIYEEDKWIDYTNQR